MGNYQNLEITALIFCLKSDRKRQPFRFILPIMPASASESALAKFENLMGSPIDEWNTEELRKLGDEAVDKARANKETDLLSDHDLSRGLELRAIFLRNIGDYDAAKNDYVEALGLMSSTSNADEGIGRVCAGMAHTHEMNGDTDQAKSFYQRAIAAFERLTPPAVLDIADISNNLAFIYEADDDFDKAETFLLAASKAYHETLGPEHEKTAVLYNNVGTLYFKAEHDDRAKKMHNLSLESRTTIFGDIHVETAQSHGNLALVLVREGEVDKAREHFDKALKGFETDLEVSRDDYEIVAANYRDVLESLKDNKAVTGLDKRLKKHKS